MQVNFNARGTAGKEGGSTILDQVVLDVASAFTKLERGAGLPNGYAPLGADGLIPIAFLTRAADLALTPSIFHVSGTSGANAALNITLPAVAGKFHYITSIRLVRAATAAVAGGALLTQVSFNLPGNPVWIAGNAIAAGQTIVDLDYHPTTPLRSLAAGVTSAVGMVAGGATVVNNLNVSYYVA